MALTDEQVKELKDQLREQVKDLPPGKKEQALGQIEAMSNEAIEEMLRQQQEKMTPGEGQKGIFRMIVDEDVPSKKVHDGDEVLAVVSKRAASKGHVIIIPRSAVADEKKIPKNAYEIAEAIAQKMKGKLKARNVKIEPFEGFGEFILNVVPEYDEPVDFSKQYEASDSEMDEVEKALWIPKPKTKPKKIVVKKKKAGSVVVNLKRRIP